MVLKCQRCGHVNDRFGSTRYCDVCGSPLPTREAAIAGMPAEAPELHAPPPEEATLSGGMAEPAGRAGSPRAPEALQPVAREPVVAAMPATAASAPVASPPVPPPLLPAQPAVAPQRALATHGRVLEGTVIRVDPLGEQPADPNVARILFSIILIADLVLLLGSAALAALAVLVAVAVLATVLRMPWLTQIIVQVVNLLFYLLYPLLQILLPRAQREQRTEPVANYLVRAADGCPYTFRIKGRLQGATVSVRDRVRVWGRPEHGILRFEGGVKLDTGESLSLPFNWYWLLLGFAAAANAIAYVVLRAHSPI